MSGAYPAGPPSTSKYGAGSGPGPAGRTGSAARDTGLDPDPVHILDRTWVYHDNPDLEAVLKLYRPNPR